MPMMLARLRRVCCYHVYVPFGNIDPALWPAEVLKRSGAVPAEMIAGRRRIKPSRKAKRAAGINSSDEEFNGDPQDEPVNTGPKRKVSKKASSATNKQKPNEAPKAAKELTWTVKMQKVLMKMQVMQRIKQMHTNG